MHSFEPYVKLKLFGCTFCWFWTLGQPRSYQGDTITQNDQINTLVNPFIRAGHKYGVEH